MKIKRIWPPTPDLATRGLLHPITNESDDTPDNDEAASDGFADTVSEGVEWASELDAFLHPELNRDAIIPNDRNDNDA